MIPAEFTRRGEVVNPISRRRIRYYVNGLFVCMRLPDGRPNVEFTMRRNSVPDNIMAILDSLARYMLNAFQEGATADHRTCPISGAECHLSRKTNRCYADWVDHALDWHANRIFRCPICFNNEVLPILHVNFTYTAMQNHFNTYHPEFPHTIIRDNLDYNEHRLLPEEEEEEEEE